MIKYSKKGLSLLDVIFAIAIAVVGLLGIVGLLRYVVLAGRVSSDRFVATNLAEEGIEIVRSYRDSNWKPKMSVFTEATFPISSATNYRVDYKQNSLLSYADTFLNIDAGGFYSYAAGTQTKFKRTIILDPTKCQVAAIDQGQCISVVSEVKWGNYTLVVEDWLYNWKP
jgi:Tfp pilus assembly protein PilV